MTLTNKQLFEQRKKKQLYIYRFCFINIMLLTLLIFIPKIIHLLKYEYDVTDLFLSFPIIYTYLLMTTIAYRPFKSFFKKDLHSNKGNSTIIFKTTDLSTISKLLLFLFPTALIYLFYISGTTFYDMFLILWSVIIIMMILITYIKRVKIFEVCDSGIIYNQKIYPWIIIKNYSFIKHYPLFKRSPISHSIKIEFHTHLKMNVSTNIKIDTDKLEEVKALINERRPSNDAYKL